MFISLVQAFEVSSLVEEKKVVPQPYRKKMVLKNWLQEIDLEEFLFEFVTLGVEEPSDFPLVCVIGNTLGMYHHKRAVMYKIASHEGRTG